MFELGVVEVPDLRVWLAEDPVFEFGVVDVPDMGFCAALELLTLESDFAVWLGGCEGAVLELVLELLKGWFVPVEFFGGSGR